MRAAAPQPENKRYKVAEITWHPYQSDLSYLLMIGPDTSH